MMQCPQCGARYNDSFRFCGVDGGRLESVQEEDPLVGHVIAGAYRIQEVIGEGGYGVVYAASHERLPVKVAVKILSRSRSYDAVAVARFKREVEAEAIVNHPHVVKVLDYGHDAMAGYYIVMEYLVGQDVGGLLELGKQLHILDIFAIIDQSGGALAAAHDLGIIHRDIKADNVFLVPDPMSPQGFSCRLLDFGVAKLTRGAPEPTTGRKRIDLNSTMHSTLLGSPCTVSPEVLKGKSADHRADIYSFGAMIFEMLTGTILFAERNIEAMLDRVAREKPPAPSTVDGAEWITPAVDELVLSMLEKEPERRPADMRTVLSRFDALRKPIETSWAAHFLSSRGRSRRVLEIRIDPPADGKRDGAPAAQTDVYVDMKPLSSRVIRERPMIMVVDDDRAIRDLQRQLIAAQGYECASLESAREALEWMGEHPPPDAIVLDLLMPGIDGITFLRELRARGYKAPVVMCTSVDSEKLRAQVAELTPTSSIDKATELYRIPEVLASHGLLPRPPA